jgi:hypothetical protein
MSSSQEVIQDRTDLKCAVGPPTGPGMGRALDAVLARNPVTMSTRPCTRPTTSTALTTKDQVAIPATAMAASPAALRPVVQEERVIKKRTKSPTEMLPPRRLQEVLRVAVVEAGMDKELVTVVVTEVMPVAGEMGAETTAEEVPVVDPVEMEEDTAAEDTVQADQEAVGLRAVDTAQAGQEAVDPRVVVMAPLVVQQAAVPLMVDTLHTGGSPYRSQGPGAPRVPAQVRALRKPSGSSLKPALRMLKQPSRR